MKKMFFLFTLTLVACGLLFAQSSASNKAAFSYNEEGVKVTNLFTDSVLFDVKDAIKTSTNGGLLIGLSMECSLWTYNSVTALNGTKNSSSAQATITATVLVDGKEVTPKQVVYCDRLQAVGVTFNVSTGVATDNVTVEVFEKTKDANHFNFFTGPLGATPHSIQVKASGAVTCKDNSGNVVACPSGTLAGAETGTKVAIGQVVLTAEEYNNFGTFKALP